MRALASALGNPRDGLPVWGHPLPVSSASAAPFAIALLPKKLRPDRLREALTDVARSSGSDSELSLS
jgi:hypothetical protein